MKDESHLMDMLASSNTRVRGETGIVGSSMKDYRKAELDLIKEDNKDLRAEKDKLSSLHNDLAYKTELLHSQVLSKEKEKEYLISKLKRK